MVDTEAVDHAIGDPPQDQLVGVLEHLWVLDAEPDQRVDVEEPAIVELTLGGAPKCQPVVLALQECVERVEIGVHGLHNCVDSSGHLRVVGTELFESGAQDLLVSVALAH